MMRSAGWVWRQWLTKSVGRTRIQIPDGYVAGEDKQLFTPSTHVIKLYLLALLNAHALSADGLAMVPHGRDKRVYAQMLQGDFDLRKAAKRAPKALTVDVDRDNDDVEQAPLAIENGGSDSDAEAEEEVVQEIVVEDAVVAEALAGDAGSFRAFDL